MLLSKVQQWLRPSPMKDWVWAGTVYIPVSPVPASRPRVGKWGTYYTKPYIRYRDAAMEALEPGDLNIEGPLACLADFAVKRPKTTKLNYPHADGDNYLKALYDLVTKKGGYWLDDKQVVWGAYTKRWAEPNEVPHSTMEIYIPCN